VTWAALLQHFLHFFIFLLVCAAAIFLFRWGFPRFIPAARVLASVFLGAHALTLVMGETLEPPTAFARWFWHLNTEWNFASTLAATQFALVGAIALCIAWFSVRRPPWQRVYFVGVAAFFIYLGWDEFSLIHEWFHDWKFYYLAAGVALIVMTTAVFRRSENRDKLFAACIPLGLALAAGGATIFDLYSIDCRSWGMIFIFGECVEILSMEESLESLGIWVALVGALGLFSNLSPRPKLFYRRALYTLPAFLVILLLSSGAIQSVSQQAAVTGSAVLESGVELQGYKIEKDKHAIRVHLFLTPSGWDFDGLGFSIAFVDQDQLDVIAVRDAYADTQLEFLLAPGYLPVYRQWVELDISEDAPRNRALLTVLTFWLESSGEFVEQKVLSSDINMLGNTHLVLHEFVIRSPSETAALAALATFDNGFKLEAVELPQRARAGEIMPVTVSWRSEAKGDGDYIQFLHLAHEESGSLFACDQQPLGNRLPTSFWYTGLADSELWECLLPADLAPGPYAVFTGLYHVRDHERLPARGVDGSLFRDARVPLGNLIVIN